MTQPKKTKSEKFAHIPWGSIIALVNVAAGITLAVGAGLATVGNTLPPALEKYGVFLSTAGLTASAIAGGLFAIGKGLYNIGDGHKAIATAQSAPELDPES